MICKSDLDSIRNSFPDSILEQPKWVCFNLEKRNGKTNKPPVSPVAGQKIGCNNPDSWATFDEAAAYCISHHLAGVGIMLDDSGLCAIDIDDCIDKAGNMTSYARRIIDRFGAYTEISISGSGVHILCLCDPDLHINCNLRQLPNSNKLEMASYNKYITISGNCIHQMHTDKNCTEDFQMLYNHQVLLNGAENKNKQNQKKSVKNHYELCHSDLAVLSMIRRSKDYQAQNLYDGVTSLNKSQADFRLCLRLMYWCHEDSAQVDRLFRGSALMRDKWDRPYSDGSTYGSRTIEAARRHYVQY